MKSGWVNERVDEMVVIGQRPPTIVITTTIFNTPDAFFKKTWSYFENLGLTAEDHYEPQVEIFEECVTYKMESIDSEELESESLKKALEWVKRAEIAAISVAKTTGKLGNHHWVDGRSHITIDTERTLQRAHRHKQKPESLIFQVHLHERLHAGIAQARQRWVASGKEKEDFWPPNDVEEKKVRDWAYELMLEAWGSEPPANRYGNKIELQS